MNPLMSKYPLLAVTVLFALLFIPSLLLAGDKKKPEDVILTTMDVDTAYKIEKLVNLKNSGTIKIGKEKNLDELRKTVSKLKSDAAIYISHWNDPTKVDVLYSDAVIVKYLSAKEIEKRNKKAKKPPVLEKEHPLDPEPVLIKQKDVDFPYRIMGVLNLKPTFFASNSAQAMDDLLREEASKYYNADGVIFVKYERSGTNVLGVTGIMIKFMESWDEVKVIPMVNPITGEPVAGKVKPKTETPKEEQKDD
jgi:hypothetical protein